MSKEWFDKELESRFREMPPELDLEAAWNRLDNSRKKDRKGLILFFFGLGLGVCLLAGGIMLMRPSVSEQAEKPEVNNDLRPVAESTSSAGSDVAATDIVPSNTIESAATISEPTSAEISDQSGTKTLSVTDVPALPLSNIAKATAEVRIGSAPLKTPALEQNQETAAFKGGGSNALEKIALKEFVPIHQSRPEWNESQTQKPSFASSNWLIGFDVNYGLLNQQLKRQIPVEIDDFSEQGMDRMGASLIIRRKARTHLFFSSGLELARFTNESRATQILESTEMQDDLLLEIRIRQDGSTEEIIGTGEVKVVEETKYSLYETHDFLYLPVEAGWQFFPEKRINLNLRTGIAFGYAFRRNGMRWTHEDEWAPKQLEATDFRTAGLLEWRLGLESQWKITEKTSFFLGLQFGTDLTDHSRQTDSFSESYRWTNARLGMLFSI
ncbi:MAG: hypothetical protein GYB31_14910 [Bacteroidetes bacterium]|nr:hypothetical protein [Bacteroidota bacterium]